MVKRDSIRKNNGVLKLDVAEFTQDLLAATQDLYPGRAAQPIADIKHGKAHEAGGRYKGNYVKVKTEYDANKTQSIANRGPTFDEAGQVRPCLKCGKIGHWVRECPENEIENGVAKMNVSESNSYLDMITNFAGKANQDAKLML